MKKPRDNKKLLKYLSSTPEDAHFNLQQLFDEKFFNFQFEDNYGFRDYPIKGKIRKRIIELLFEIHDKWKIELDKLNRSYYLAIWLHEPNIIYSDVVCAIDDRIHLYTNNWFDNSAKKGVLIKQAYGKNQAHFERFSWERKKDYEKHYSSDFESTKKGHNCLKHYYRDQRKFRRIKQKCTKIEESLNGKIYFEEVGDIWVGQLIK